MLSKIMTPQEQIAAFIDQSLEGTDCFLVDYKIKPTNNYKIFIDSDTGFTLEKAIGINRKIRKLAEEAGLYPEGDYSLEVSSPGVDAPLKLHRQFVKNIGRKLEVELKDEAAAGIVGKLLQVDEHKMTIEETPPQKTNSHAARVAKLAAEPKLHELAFDDIKSAMVCIEF
jgi:ribosome maturation factor RimP